MDQRKWTYLIAKNQERDIDDGVVRLINNFLYSQKERDIITSNVLKLMHSLTVVKPERIGPTNVHWSVAADSTNVLYVYNIPKAVVQIFIDEKMND